MPKCCVCRKEFPTIIAGRCRQCNVAYMIKKRRDENAKREKERSG